MSATMEKRRYRGRGDVGDEGGCCEGVGLRKLVVVAEVWEIHGLCSSALEFLGMVGVDLYGTVSCWLCLAILAD